MSKHTEEPSKCMGYHCNREVLENDVACIFHSTKIYSSSISEATEKDFGTLAAPVSEPTTLKKSFKVPPVAHDKSFSQLQAEKKAALRPAAQQAVENMREHLEAQVAHDVDDLIYTTKVPSDKTKSGYEVTFDPDYLEAAINTYIISVLEGLKEHKERFWSSDDDIEYAIPVSAIDSEITKYKEKIA